MTPSGGWGRNLTALFQGVRARREPTPSRGVLPALRKPQTFLNSVLPGDYLLLLVAVKWRVRDAPAGRPGARTDRLAATGTP